MEKITFDINPLGKPRMVRSDSWNKRPAVQRYWEFKDRINIQANLLGYIVTAELFLEFIIPMSDSWTDKKKALMIGKPHQQTPDIDNLVKSFLDALCDQDNFVYYISAKKTWGNSGKIIVYKDNCNTFAV